MAANTSPIFELAPWNKGVQIVNADGTTKKKVFDAGSNASRVDQINCSTTDTSGETLSFWAYDGSSIYYHLGDVVLAAGAGYGSVALVNAVATLSPPPTASQNPSVGYLTLQSGYSLYVSVGSAVTSGKQTDVVAQGGDY